MASENPDKVWTLDNWELQYIYARPLLDDGGEIYLTLGMRDREAPGESQTIEVYIDQAMAKELGAKLVGVTS